MKLLFNLMRGDDWVETCVPVNLPIIPRSGDMVYLDDFFEKKYGDLGRVVCVVFRLSGNRRPIIDVNIEIFQ